MTSFWSLITAVHHQKDIRSPKLVGLGKTGPDFALGCLSNLKNLNKQTNKNPESVYWMSREHFDMSELEKKKR